MPSKSEQKQVKQRLDEVRPPRSAEDLARAMFVQADQRRPVGWGKGATSSR